MLTPSHMLPPHIGTILLTHAPPLPHPPDTRTPPHTRTSLTCNSSHALPSHTHPYSHTHPFLTRTPLFTRIPSSHASLSQTRNPLTHSPSSHTHHPPPCNAPPSNTSTPSSQTPLLTHTPLTPAAPHSPRGRGVRGFRQWQRWWRPAVTSVPALQKLGSFQQALHVDHPHLLHGHRGRQPGPLRAPFPGQQEAPQAATVRRRPGTCAAGRQASPAAARRALRRPRHPRRPGHPAAPAPLATRAGFVYLSARARGGAGAVPRPAPSRPFLCLLGNVVPPCPLHAGTRRMHDALMRLRLTKFRNGLRET